MPKQGFIAKIFLQIILTVFTHRKNLRHGESFFTKMIGEIKEGFVFADIIPVGSNH